MAVLTHGELNEDQTKAAVPDTSDRPRHGTGLKGGPSD